MPIMRTLLAVLILLLPTFALATVNLQTCAVAPTLGGLIGCPAASVKFAPVSPSTLVRSQVAGVQGWRAFGSLSPTDSVVSQSDGAWHVLSSLTVTTSSPTPPVVAPPGQSPPTAPLAQSVTITLVGGGPPQAVTFAGVPSPSCFALSTANAMPKQICVP